MRQCAPVHFISALGHSKTRTSTAINSWDLLHSISNTLFSESYTYSWREPLLRRQCQKGPKASNEKNCSEHSHLNIRFLHKFGIGLPGHQTLTQFVRSCHDSWVIQLTSRAELGDGHSILFQGGCGLHLGKIIQRLFTKFDFKAVAIEVPLRHAKFRSTPLLVLRCRLWEFLIGKSPSIPEDDVPFSKRGRGEKAATSLRYTRLSRS